MTSAILNQLAEIIETRKRADPNTSYVAALFQQGHDAMLKKIIEEAGETVLAAKDGDKLQLVSEVADLWFHCVVLLSAHELKPEAVFQELARRQGVSGLVEKANRSKEC